jgi:exodeoxyribonuclease V beta subunit
MSAAHPTYDPLGPLPESGTHVLEASAGTGKTYAIKELVGRIIAETGIGLDEMLIMTYTRSAAGELRDRIRSTLREQLVTASPEVRPRLEVAISQLDDAMIGTTHAFCSTAFARLGIRGDADTGAQLVEQIQDVVLDATTDTCIRAPERLVDAGVTGWAATSIGRQVAQHPGIPLVPDGTDPRPDLAGAIRQGIAAEQRRLGVVTFDDLVLRLLAALRHEDNGAAVAQMLRQQYRVVFIDEFQDTDPAQWEIVQRAFHGSSLVFLVGDPKQGIYAFRGADINSYLQAARTADDIATLDTNHRSDEAVIDGVLELLQTGPPARGLALGAPEIVVHPVRPSIAGPRLTGPGLHPRLRVRLRLIGGGPAIVGQRRLGVAQDTAHEIARLLAAEPELDDGGSPRPLQAGDVAVIVRTNAQAALVRDELVASGIAAVINTRDSVFTSRAARALLDLLRAMERPGGSTLRRAVLAGLFATGPTDLAVDEEASLAAAAERVLELNRIVAAGGVPALLTAVAGDPALVQRSLAFHDGERFLTDLRQLGALLTLEARTRGRGMLGLADWLAEEIDDAQRDEPPEALTRRIDSDAAAVQVVTVHRCKGLQYPVAFVPYGWDSPPFRGGDAVVFHDEDAGRRLDVRSRSHPQRTDSDARAQREQAGEDLRMLYVALTRAASLLVVTHLDSLPDDKDRGSPLDRVLFARSRADVAPQLHYRGSLPTAPFTHVEVQRLAFADIDGGTEPPTGLGEALPAAPDSLTAAPYTRDVDTAWSRASFTGLVRVAPRVSPMEQADETAAAETLDEPPGDPELLPGDASPAPPDTGLAAPSPMAGLPAGAGFGTLVHAVLEHVATDADDLTDEVLRQCQAQLLRRPMADVTPQSLATALVPVLHTPLGSLLPETSLADVAPADRLAELDFELPLQQGGPQHRVGDIGDLLAGAADEPGWVREYGRTLRDAEFSWKQLRGYLTGSIDAVLRASGGRCFVVDYKTNRLGATLADYHPDRLPAAMAEAHYPLQALLYQVALHRFLDRRMAGYDPAQHLGGILYLFVRGMAGPGTPVAATGDPCGVFAWRPGPELVARISTVLGGERP